MHRTLFFVLAIALTSFLAVGALRPSAQAPSPPVLVGKITDAAGRGIPGAKVTLYGGMGTRFIGQTATTNEKGEYRFDPLTTGNNRWDAQARVWHISVGMRVMHAEYASPDGETWWEVSGDAREGTPHRHDLQFAKGGKIRGEVLNAHGDFPAGEITLRIEREDHTSVTYAVTDHRGRFESEALAPGEYIVRWNSPLVEKDELARVPVQRERATRTTIRMSVSVTAKATAPSYTLLEPGEEGK